MIDISRQRFIIARFADYCDHRSSSFARASDPILYLWEKLHEIVEPLLELKNEMLRDTVSKFFAKAKSKSGVSENDILELRHLLDRYLSRGDYADAFFHLSADVMADPKRRDFAQTVLAGLKAQNLLDEEGKPQAQRSKGWNELVGEIYGRLGIDVLDRCVERRGLDGRRLRFILRRLRRNTADYCAVLHVPRHADDTFTPFILPRIEALVAANRRFLRRLRTT